MNNTDYRTFYMRISILLFFQLFVADYFNYISNALIYFQVLVLIWLPLSLSFFQTLPIILLFALIIDFFHHTLGLNLIVCTFVLYFRTHFILFLTDKDDEIKVFHIYEVGFKKFFYYALLINLFFYTALFSVEFFRISFAWNMFYKWGISFLGMTIFTILLDYILIQPRKSKISIQ